MVTTWNTGAAAMRFRHNLKQKAKKKTSKQQAMRKQELTSKHIYGNRIIKEN